MSRTSAFKDRSEAFPRTHLQPLRLLPNQPPAQGKGAIFCDFLGMGESPSLTQGTPHLNKTKSSASPEYRGSLSGYHNMPKSLHEFSSRGHSRWGQRYLAASPDPQGMCPQGSLGAAVLEAGACNSPVPPAQAAPAQDGPLLPHNHPGPGGHLQRWLWEGEGYQQGRNVDPGLPEATRALSPCTPPHPSGPNQTPQTVEARCLVSGGQGPGRKWLLLTRGPLAG